MERLTKKDVFIGNYINEEVYTIGTDDESVDTAYTGKAIDRLTDLEDKIERGELVEVVRCFRCKNREISDCADGIVYCIKHKTYFWDDFGCERGERSGENV